MAFAKRRMTKFWSKAEQLEPVLNFMPAGAGIKLAIVWQNKRETG